MKEMWIMPMYGQCMINVLTTSELTLFFFSFFLLPDVPMSSHSGANGILNLQRWQRYFYTFLMSSCNLVVGQNVKSNIFFCCWWVILDSIFCSWHKNKQTTIFAFKTVAIFSKATSAIWNALRAQIIYGPGWKARENWISSRDR